MATPLACTNVGRSIVVAAINNDHSEELLRRNLTYVTGVLEFVRNQRETDIIASCELNW